LRGWEHDVSPEESVEVNERLGQSERNRHGFIRDGEVVSHGVLPQRRNGHGFVVYWFVLSGPGFGVGAGCPAPQPQRDDGDGKSPPGGGGGAKSAHRTKGGGGCRGGRTLGKEAPRRFIRMCWPRFEPEEAPARDANGERSGSAATVLSQHVGRYVWWGDSCS